MTKILKGTDGATAVEFALIASVLFVLLFGIFEFAVALYDKGVIAYASREGARWGAAFYINPENGNATHPLCDDVKTHIENSVLSTYPLISFTGSAALMGCCGRGCTPSSSWSTGGAYESGINYIENGDSITVQYQYDFLVFGNLFKLLGGATSGLTLQSTSLMRDENQH